VYVYQYHLHKKGRGREKKRGFFQVLFDATSLIRKKEGGKRPKENLRSKCGGGGGFQRKIKRKGLTQLFKEKKQERKESGGKTYPQKIHREKKIKSTTGKE